MLLVETPSIQKSLTDYTKEVAAKILDTDFALLSQIVEAILETRKRGGTIFTAGNGGSAATASHMANDLTKGCRAHGREGFRIECLADSTAVLTCLANDFSYDDVFHIQLRTKAKKGDMLVVFSGSGNSPNIVKAVDTANEMGLCTVGFSGRDGGKLAGRCHYLLIAPTPCMEQLEDMHMLYEHAMACTLRECLEDAWGMEIIRYPRQDTQIQSAIFDFDGTISLIREGWQEIMIPYFVEILSATPGAEDPQQLLTCVRDFVDTLTGKQTIFQCIRLEEEVQKRGGKPEAPLTYKNEYLRRLNLHIAARKQQLQQGCDPANYLVPGSVELLEKLRDAGIKCYLASGTDETDVLAEAALLGVGDCFDGGIYGAKDDMTECAKEIVIRKILKDNAIDGSQLLSFGDGYVEIELVDQLGGYAIGVATDEVRKKGINLWKRRRLLEAGASAIIPDFSEPDKIVDFIRTGVL